MQSPPFARTLCHLALAALWPVFAQAQTQVQTQGQSLPPTEGALTEITIVANKPVGNTGIALD